LKGSVVMHKKKLYISLVLIIIGMMFSACGKKEPAKEPSETKAATTQETKGTKQENKKADDIKKDSAEIEKAKSEFAAAKLNEENTKKAVAAVIKSEKLKEVTLTVEKGKNIVDVTYNPGDVLNEEALVKNNAVTASNVMEILFQNPKVDKVWVWTETTMLDDKGNSEDENVVNVALSKENAEGINWPKFKETVLEDYNKLFDISDSKFIHPSISKAIK
jgi:predicted small lipoprotein YifL